jgi:hypothetical protein
MNESIRSKNERTPRADFVRAFDAEYFDRRHYLLLIVASSTSFTGFTFSFIPACLPCLSRVFFKQ